jgi:hypothetical protein
MCFITGVREAHWWGDAQLAQCGCMEDIHDDFHAPLRDVEIDVRLYVQHVQHFVDDYIDFL